MEPPIEPSHPRRRLGLRGLGAVAWILAVVAVAAGAYLATTHTRTGERLELATVDARFAIRGESNEAPPAVAIVKINDETDDRLGSRFPYPRAFYADAIRALHDAGARAVVFDVNFDFASGSVSDDQALVTAARANQPVVFVTGLEQHDSKKLLPPEPLLGIHFPGVERNEAFEYSRSAYGIANVTYARDGTVREWDVRPTYAGTERPSLAYAALTSAQEPGVDPASLPSRVTVNYRTPADRFHQLNLADVLEGTDLEEVAGRTVFIGATSAVLHDVHKTPYDPTMPGVMVHAQVYENLRTGDWLEEVPGWVGAIAAVALVGLWALCLTRFALGTGLVLAVAGTGVYALLAHELFVQRLLVAPVAGPIVAALAGGFAMLVVIAWRALRERRRIASMFGRYVAPDIVRELIRRGDIDGLAEGNRCEVTMLFADVRGFTAMSEHSDPGAVVAQLNDYLSAMTEAIHGCGGTIDKFMGDGIMALFGAPLPQEDHADRACAAAAAMLEALDALNARRQEAGIEPLRIGIGINTGYAIVGNIGSHRRLDYTAIGDCVNLASRLEAATKEHGVTVLVSRATHDATQSSDLTPLGAVTVRGRTQLTEVYTLAGHAGSQQTGQAPAA